MSSLPPARTLAEVLARPDGPVDFIAVEESRRAETLAMRAIEEGLFPDQVAACQAYARAVLGTVTDLFDRDQTDGIWRADLMYWDGYPAYTPPADARYVPLFARTEEDWGIRMRNIAKWAFHDGIEAMRSGVTIESTPLPYRRYWAERPEEQPYGVSDEGAEQYVADWMKYLGVRDAEVTRYGNDGGIDVTSARYIAQVKNYGPKRSVGVAAIREFAGVAHLDGRSALFFTSGTYAAGAQAVAQQAGILLFRYRAELQLLEGIGVDAERCVLYGLPDAS